MRMKFNPVAWMSTLLTVLIAVDSALAGNHAYSPTVAAWVGGVIALLTALLGVLTHKIVTPLARPRDSSRRPLVPKP